MSCGKSMLSTCLNNAEYLQLLKHSQPKKANVDFIRGQHKKNELHVTIFLLNKKWVIHTKKTSLY